MFCNDLLTSPENLYTIDSDMFAFLLRLLPTYRAYAHCDVPCGIYDPKAAQVAAATVLKMVQKIKELTIPECHDIEAKIAYENTMTRLVWTKEEHAQKCKEELLILWTDYFKPEHLTKFPNLHETFWKATKLCSKNKQNVEEQAAKDLVAAVDEIADMFEKSKAK